MRPDWQALHQELKKPGVTLMLLWQEYRAQHADGYAYSQFCEHYRRWARRLKPSMRQVHRAGEKLFVDFSGRRPQLVDPNTGEEITVELFVGVLGASGLIYAEATRSQDLPSWITAHVRMLDYFHGSPAIWVSDNLKSGVTSAHRYEPEINRTYRDLAQHYDAVVIPARVARPKDKPKAEVSVQIAQRWVLAALRHQTFFTLADLNAAIRGRVDAINDRPMTVVGVSRRTLYEQIDRPALKPLPATRYELAEWKIVRANIDYHVAVDHNFYSVPYQLIDESLDARFSASTVEVFFKNRRVAVHARLTGRGRYATRPEHMPPRASRARGVDALAADRLGGTDRPRHGPARRRHSCPAPAPCAGLPRVSGPDALRARLRRGPARSRLPARGAAALLSLSHRRAHSHTPAGSAAARPAACPSGPDARERARRHLLRGDLC